MVDDDDPKFVRAEDCRDKHAKIDLALFGADGRGGMVKDMGDVKNYMREESERRAEEKAKNTEKKKEETTKKRDYRGFGFAVLGGIIVAVVSWVFKLI
jgi:hypothetical protein